MHVLTITQSIIWIYLLIRVLEYLCYKIIYSLFRRIEEHPPLYDLVSRSHIYQLWFLECNSGAALWESTSDSYEFYNKIPLIS